MSRERYAPPRSLAAMARSGTALLLLAAGCLGGLENAPLRQGQVRGRLTGAEAAGARVFLLGHPELAAAAADDGSFAIAGVPVGSYVVVASAASSALQAEVHVAPGEAAAPASVALEPAAWLVVRVRRDGVELPGVQLALEPTPLGGETDEAGRARLPALPPGCYALVLHEGEARHTRSACLAGQGAVQLEVELGTPPPDAGPEDAGPADAGPPDAGSEPDAGPEPDAGRDLCEHACLLPDGGESGLRCDPASGHCYECLAIEDCPAPQSCVNHQCSPEPRPPCSPLSSTVGSEAWNSRDLKSRPH